MKKAQILSFVLKLALEMKARPADYWDALKRRTLLMFFEKPSLRTRVSLEAGTTLCGNQTPTPSTR